MGEQEELPFPMATSAQPTQSRVAPSNPVANAAAPMATSEITTATTTKSYEFEPRDFASLDPKDYGIDFTEEPLTYGEELLMYNLGSR